MKRPVQAVILLVTIVLVCSTGCGPATPTPETLPHAVVTATAAASGMAAPAPTLLPEPTATREPMATPAETMLAPEGIPQETYYAPFPLTITLDGDLSDWEGVPLVTIPEEAKEYPDLSAVTFAAAADDKYLYFVGEVTDDSIISGEHGTDYWNEDSVEFYVNATGDLALTSYIDGVAQITVPPLNIGLNPGETVVGGVRGDTVGAQVAAVRTDKGYLGWDENARPTIPDQRRTQG